MPSAVAEAEAAAMDNAVDVWRLNTASRLHYAAPRRMRRAVAPTKEWDGCTMKDPFELLREASEAYNNDLRPWEVLRLLRALEKRRRERHRKAKAKRHRGNSQRDNRMGRVP